jgi:hypothetical protein
MVRTEFIGMARVYWFTSSGVGVRFRRKEWITAFFAR